MHSQAPASGAVRAALAEQAEACTGAVVRERMILEIECRYLGADRRVRVGEPGVQGGVVEAIFQLGRDRFTIHHSPDLGPPDAPVVLRLKDVYSVTEFD